MNAPEDEQAAENPLRARLTASAPLIKPSEKWLDEDYLVIDIESAQHIDFRRPATGVEMFILRRPDHPTRSRRAHAAASERD